jgi:serine/threonine protein kinase
MNKLPLSFSKATENGNIFVQRHHLLGNGRFGTVYVGFLEGEKVAVKRVNVTHVEDEDSDGIDEEITLSKIKHPNVVQLLSVEKNADYK